MTCCDNMPMPKVDVTCKNCWWHGRRHSDHWEDVNDVYSAGEVDLRIPITRFNVGTPSEFKHAAPTNRQIKLAFGVNCQIETSGDDMHIEVERKRDGYPIGRMECVSHVSLSPIRAKHNAAAGKVA